MTILFKFFKQYNKSVLFSLFIFIISIFPVNNEAAKGLFNIPYMDKIVHFIFYAVLSFLLLLELKEKKKINRYIIAVLICFLIGGSIEIIQSTLPQRTSDVLDIAANFLGSLVSIPVYNYLKN